MSAPAQNARSPAPVSTTQRTPGSRSTASQISLRAASAAESTAFRRSGRSRVTRATPSARSKRTSPPEAPAPSRSRVLHAADSSPLGSAISASTSSWCSSSLGGDAGSRTGRRTSRSASDEANRPGGGGLRFDDHPVESGLGIGERFLERHDRRAQDVDALESFHPVGGRAGRELLSKDCLELRAVRGLLLVVSCTSGPPTGRRARARDRSRGAGSA